MLSYYDILKNNGVVDAYNTIKGKYCNYNYENLNKIFNNKTPTSVMNVYDFINTFINSVYLTYLSRTKKSHVYYIEKDVSYLLAEDKSGLGYYKNPFEISPGHGTLGIAIMDTLFDQFKADDLLTLINMVDPNDSPKKLEEIVADLLLSNNEYFGYYLPYSKIRNPLKLNKPLKIHRFKIQSINDFMVWNGPVYYNPYYKVGDGPIILESLTDKRIKVASNNASWMFSINKEHLMENLNNMQEISESLISKEKETLSNRIKESKQYIKDHKSRIIELSNKIENFNEYKKTLWKSC